MTNSDYTAVMLLVDRSGSMQAIRKSAEESIDEFVHGLAKSTGKRTIRIAQFDFDVVDNRMRYDTVCESIDPGSVKPFRLDPWGATPLLDAMGRSLAEFGAELAAMPEPERPGTVIYAVMTDGKENTSQEYSWDVIKASVERQQEDYGWHIVYLGANQDAFEIGERLGVPQHSTMTYSATDYGTRSATSALSTYVASAASGESASFTDEQRKDAIS